MSVAVVSSYRQECGIGTYTDALGQALVGRGHRVVVLAMQLDARARYFSRGGVLPYVRCWRREGWYADLEKHVSSTASQVFHVEHEYGLHSDPAAFMIWLERLPRPIVITLHTVPDPCLEQERDLRWLPTALSGNRARCIVHQQAGADALRAYGCRQVTIIPHGSDPGLTPTPRHEARRRLGLPHDGVLGATLGFWTPGKRNADTMVALMRLISRRALPDDFRFVFAGQPMGGDADAEIRHWCARLEQLKLADRIIVRPGYVDDAVMCDYFGAADFIVANSGPTMFSISGRGHLCMGYGAAVLAADVPLLSEFRECGLVFGSGAQLEDGLRRLAHDVDLRQRLSAQSRAYAEQTSWARVAEMHEQVYEEALSP